jgi:hypothetical protein
MSTSFAKFIESESLPAHDIWYYISDKKNKKIPIGEKNDRTLKEVQLCAKKVTPPPPSLASPTESASLTKAHAVFLKHVQDLYVLDVDEVSWQGSFFMEHFIKQNYPEKNAALLSKVPWTTGNTKGIHMYLKVVGTPSKYTHQQKVFRGFDGDFLHVNNVWEKHGKIVYNYHGSIPTFQWSEIEFLFDLELLEHGQTRQIETEMDNKRKVAIRNHLKENKAAREQASRADDQSLLQQLIPYLTYISDGTRDMWIRGLMGIHAAGGSLEDALEFSNLSPDKADENETRRQWRSLKPRDGGITLSSIVYWARQADKAAVNAILAARPSTNVTPMGEAEYLVENELIVIRYCQQMLWVFNPANGLWTNDKNKVLCHVMQVARGKYGQVPEQAKQVLKCMPDMVDDPTLFDRLQNSGLKKLLFKNGVLDLETGQLLSFSPEYFFPGAIDHDWVPLEDREVVDLEYIEDIKTRFITNPLGEEVGGYYLQRLARALAGDRLKGFGASIGDTNCGKSTLVNMLMSTFSPYIGMFNCSNLALKDSPDQAASLRWALLARFKRIMCASEAKEGTTFCSATVKMLSGGDVLVGRTHCAEEVSFNNHFYMMMFANVLLDFKPFDEATDDRLEVFGFTKQFVKGEPKNENEIKGVSPDDMAKEFATLRFQRALAALMIREYQKPLLQQPPACKAAKEVYSHQEVGCMSSFQEEFQLTGNPSDHVSSSELTSWLEGSKNGVSFKNFIRDMKKHATSLGLEVETKPVRVRGKLVRSWVGIRRLGEEDECQVVTG